MVSQAAWEPGRPSGAIAGGKVLIVDDQAANVTVLSRMMRRLGYTTVSAADGEAALDAVVRERPDVVLLDINMPRLDGFEVCQRLKADPATRLIPVVLLTSLTAVEDRVRGIEAGADDFLTKPYVAVELEARVRSLTRLKRYTDELDSAASVILTLGRTIEARRSVRRAIASASRVMRPRWANIWASPTISSWPCIEAATCTTSARWAFPMPSC